MNNQQSKRDVFSDFENDLKSGKRKPILLIGISIFAWSAIGSIAYLIKAMSKDVFLNIGIVPELNIFITELLDFAIYIIGILFLFRVIRLNKFSYINILKFSIVFLIISQILQFFQPMLNTKMMNEGYLDNSSEYYRFLSDNPEYYYISALSSVVVWIVIIYIILNERKSNLIN